MNKQTLFKIIRFFAIISGIIGAISGFLLVIPIIPLWLSITNQYDALANTSQIITPLVLVFLLLGSLSAALSAIGMHIGKEYLKEA